MADFHILAESSPAFIIFATRFLVTASNSGDSLDSGAQDRLPNRTDLVAPALFKITPRHGPRRNTPFPTVPLLLRVDSLLRERVYRAVA
jgi:hypothetical protein